MPPLVPLVALIMMCALRQDILRCSLVDEEDLQEVVGWKLVHGDVFRSPNMGTLLASYCVWWVPEGTGFDLAAKTAWLLYFC